MIRNLTVNVNADRSVSPRELRIANQYEIKTNRLEFNFNFETEGNKYVLLMNHKGSYYYPLVNNSLTFDSSETWIGGGWTAHILISDAAIIDGKVDKTKALFVSDDFGLFVESNDIDIDSLKEQELPAQLKLMYDDLLELKEQLEKVVESGGPVSFEVDPELSLSSTNTVQNKVITAEFNQLKESIVEEIGSDTLIFDGNYEGLTILDITEQMGSIYYKISDCTPTLQETQQGVVVTSQIGSFDMTYSIQSINDVSYVIGTMIVVLEDNADVNGILIPEAGIYVPPEGAFTLTINGYTGFTKTKLKEELLPESPYYLKIEDDGEGNLSLGSGNFDEAVKRIKANSIVKGVMSGGESSSTATTTNASNEITSIVFNFLMIANTDLMIFEVTVNADSTVVMSNMFTVTLTSLMG